jgi:integrase
MGWIQSVAIEATDGPAAIPQKPVETYSEGDIQLLLSIARARDFRFWTYLLALSETGCRASELLGAKYSDLRLDSEVPYLNLPTTKTKQRLVPLTTKLRAEVFTPEVIERLKARGNPRFLRDISKYPWPWTYSTACGVLKTCCDRANVRYTGFHIFRHSYATRMLAKPGVSLYAVSLLLGHSDPSTTSRVYGHCDALSFSHLID